MTLISRLVGIPAVVAACALIILSMFAQTSPPPPPCLEFTPDQERIILEWGVRFAPGGDLFGYPIMADRAIRQAFLTARGVTDDIFNLQFKAGYLHQTVMELKKGYCWNASSGTVLSILETLKGVW